jgi:enediyne polyketide synthase
MPPAPSIAITGMACVYPDARTPLELWENAISQRRAFRRLPQERLRAEDYFSPNRTAPDCTYSFEAAVIEGYEFDRVAFRVVGSTYRSADLAHWLALDVAARALEDAGFPDGKGLPRETTGVLLGNSLTGEFSRSNIMRLRWPYVRRVVHKSLVNEGWSAEDCAAFLDQLEEEFKRPFPPTGEETLAGGLSNTIAGRICNHFNLNGGGYTVDGACASSLLAVANACSALASGDLDVALAGGVDLSLDPFELVGFAKTDALTTDEMRIFDRRSSGFMPGEGCGFVTLMRHDDALARGGRIYAIIRGWGISSDGSGGITRPVAEGQLQALQRAYRRAGFDTGTVPYCECHGTGTAVGDATELEVLSRARQTKKRNFPPAAVGSVKANIGHTKAAAGVAGLIKATMAVHTQVVPPTVGCEQPHELLRGGSRVLRALAAPEIWPQGQPLRASVSAMGFGGINAHVVLECQATERRTTLEAREALLGRSYQDVELFLLNGGTKDELRKTIDLLSSISERMSRAEMADLAAALQKQLGNRPLRAAITASKQAELSERLAILRASLDEPHDLRLDFTNGTFFGSAGREPRIAFLFPGQGSPTYLDGGLWRRRFQIVDELYAGAKLPQDADTVSTRVMQPAVVTASLAGLMVLRNFGIKAEAAIGHSLGEITALHWAGALDQEVLMEITRTRGALMAELGASTGAMMAIAAPAPMVQNLLLGTTVSIVGFNSPEQTVVAGEAAEITHVGKLASAAGCRSTILPVSHAFHTHLVAAAVPPFTDCLRRQHFNQIHRQVFSTVTGALLQPDDDLRALLSRQVTSPVLFAGALECMLTAKSAELSVGKVTTSWDLLIEIGPGNILSELARHTSDVPTAAIDAGGHSIQGLLHALGAAYALGTSIRHCALFDDRFTRPFILDRQPKFFINPCELGAADEPASRSVSTPDLDSTAQFKYGAEKLSQNGHTARGNGGAQTDQHLPDTRPLGASNFPDKPHPGRPLDLIRQLVAKRTELPLHEVQETHCMLSDLHLNSISVGQIVSEAAKTLGLPQMISLTDFANATSLEIANALEHLQDVNATTHGRGVQKFVPGVDVWVEPFAVELKSSPRLINPRNAGAFLSSAPSPRTPESNASSANWRVLAPHAHPLAEPLREKLSRAKGNGIVVCINENPLEEHVSLLLEAARKITKLRDNPCFAVVQHGWGGSGFARTLHLETGLTTCIVNVPPDLTEAADWVISELASAHGYIEAHYNSQGQRNEPYLRWLKTSFSDSTAGQYPIESSDVLLVTGGGKGIAAECALAIGKVTGASVALMGRSNPETDSELGENLKRIRDSGVRCCYLRADVTNAAAVRRAVAEGEKKLGPITALLHAAGNNSPRLISALSKTDFQRTLAPKIEGARNLLATLKPDQMRLFITFGSIIARAGFRGEADYATANEWLTALTERFQAQHPKCRCLALEWSVWSGLGMGERLGRLESLQQEGVVPIPPEAGVRVLLDLLKAPQPAVAIVVTGRFGSPPTLRLKRAELPLTRFLESERIYYPNVELIVDVKLSAETDPYLEDHVVQKERLFPAVMGLEAMAQVAMALTGSAKPPKLENVHLAHPVVARDKQVTTIRIAALRRGADLVEVCVRSEQTEYQVDYFRALCRFTDSSIEEIKLRLTGLFRGEPFPPPVTCTNVDRPASSDSVCLDPGMDLYGQVLFHQGRFCRLRKYHLLNARECVAEILSENDANWFGRYLPADLMLGDPGARDAAVHAIQACIPHRRILPLKIDSISIQVRTKQTVQFVRAKERMHEGKDFVFDLEIAGPDGELIEVWEGLHLRAVEEIEPTSAWPESLLAPYLERRFGELVTGGDVRIAFERTAALRKRPSRNGAAPRHDKSIARTQITNGIIQQTFGTPKNIYNRIDGKPITSSSETISAAHALDFTLAMVGNAGIACDCEPVKARTDEAWFDLLGEVRFRLANRISREQSESLNISATRMWTVLECLKKAGLPAGAPLIYESRERDGWIVVRSGNLLVATCHAVLKRVSDSIVIALSLYPAHRPHDPSSMAAPTPKLRPRQKPMTETNRKAHRN